jgi:hypothetical protein
MDFAKKKKNWKQRRTSHKFNRGSHKSKGTHFVPRVQRTCLQSTLSAVHVLRSEGTFQSNNND